MSLSRYILRGLFISIAFCVIFVSIALFYKPSILSYDQEILLPFTYGISGDDKFFQKDNWHPLMIGLSAFALQNEWKNTKDPTKLDLAKRYLEFLAEEYPHIEENENLKQWKYPSAWRDLQPGWYSGLANSCIALAFLSGYQVFGNSKYQKLAIKALNGVVKTVEQGGCAVEIGSDSHWFEEYAWRGLNKANAYFVNNGFLVALLTVKLFADQTNNPNFKNAFKKGLDAFKQTADSFYYDSGDWTYYMLNPKEIETPNYAIYDLVIYKALYKLTSDKIFKEHISKRERILQKAYPLSFCSGSDGESEFIFSTIGPPHPYLLDKTKLRITFFDRDKQICTDKFGKDRKDDSSSINERLFITGKFCRDAYRFEVSSQTSSSSYLRWYKSKLNWEILDNCQSEATAMSYDLTCAYDAVPSGIKEILVDPSIITKSDSINDYTNNIAVAILQTKEPINLNLYKYFGILAKPTISTKLIGINIYDQSDQVAVRYYIPLKENFDNLILLNRLGFLEIDKLSDSISRMDIVIFTSEYSENQKFSIKFSDIFLYRNERELNNFFKKNSFYFPHQF